MEKVTASSYTLRDDNGGWLGQIVLTNDGMFSAVTDWGNFGFAWRHIGDEDFRKFLIDTNIDYFAGKMYQGISYTAHGKQVEKSCQRFAEKILPALQLILKAEIKSELRKRVNAVDPDQILNDVLNGFVSGKYKQPKDSNSIAQFVIDYLKTK